MAKIKMIFFDFDGVLAFGGFSKFLPKISKMSGRSVNELEALIYRNVFPELTAGRISDKEYWEKVIELLSLQKKFKNWKQIDALFFTTFTLNKKLVAFAKKLKLKRIILSNSNKRWFKLRLKLLHLTGLFKGILSSEIGINKNEKGFFEKVLPKLRLKPQECVLIDDLERNLVPARELGIHTILFKNNAQAISDLKKVLLEK
ncbi:MAG: HAD family phosphatase [Candidatus Diapherotrites archaeon]|nr:HAD family phosphatase [Candidatus Diapherotrites archaeon]